MQKAFLEVNGVRTCVETYGRWVEESPSSDNDEIVIIIPGNPGLPGFYHTFGQSLHEKLNLPVWVVGHAGHTMQKNAVTPMPALKDNESLYGLRGQVEHKIAFFEKYVPANTKVHLIGHSIGAYIILEMLEEPQIEQRVKTIDLLFPTIEHMAETRNGKFLLGPLRHIIPLVCFLGSFFSILPTIIQQFLLFCYFFITRVSFKDNYKNVHHLLNAKILRRVFFMAYEEMDIVKQRNQAVIMRNIDKLNFLYGRDDNWAPKSYYDRLKLDIPQANAKISSFRHAFLLEKEQTLEVAKIVCDWIQK